MVFFSSRISPFTSTVIFFDKSPRATARSEEHTSELQSPCNLVCRLLLEKKKFTNDQIKEMTRKVSAEVDLVHQQTHNQRYGSSHIGATAKDIYNVVTVAVSGVVDIFYGIHKDFADFFFNFCQHPQAFPLFPNSSPYQ